MSNRILKVFGGVLLAGALASPLLVSAGPQPQPAQEHERHPVIRESIEKIESARHDLQAYADRDFGGHRAKAVGHLDQALRELHMALDYDRR
ncbi:MAG TPA: hypothetical protein VFB23_14830 [Candidatus Acidoferrales bacterium]|jgi:hypothetical protein|nr:hypothetical protein [Candidatus Acidoferrales bacterium]